MVEMIPFRNNEGGTSGGEATHYGGQWLCDLLKMQG